MWRSSAKIRGNLVLSKLGANRFLSAAGTPPVDEGLRLESATKEYPSFWNRLKQQKNLIGKMALSGSVAILAMCTIKQEKELNRYNESAAELRQQEEVLGKKLDDLRSVLEESDRKNEREVLGLLRDVVDLNGEGGTELLNHS